MLQRISWNYLHYVSLTPHKHAKGAHGLLHGQDFCKDVRIPQDRDFFNPPFAVPGLHTFTSQSAPSPSQICMPSSTGTWVKETNGGSENPKSNAISAFASSSEILEGVPKFGVISSHHYLHYIKGVSCRFWKSKCPIKRIEHVVWRSLTGLQRLTNVNKHIPSCSLLAKCRVFS